MYNFCYKHCPLDNCRYSYLVQMLSVFKIMLILLTLSILNLAKTRICLLQYLHQSYKDLMEMGKWWFGIHQSFKTGRYEDYYERVPLLKFKSETWDDKRYENTPHPPLRACVTTSLEGREMYYQTTIRTTPKDQGDHDRYYIICEETFS